MSPASLPNAVRFQGSLLQDDPARVYREMRREHGSVVPVVLDGDAPAWLVLGYRELHQVTGDPGLFSRDSELWNQWENIPDDWPLLPMIGHRQPSILYTVGERHRERAAMLGTRWKRSTRSNCAATPRSFADELIDGICPRGTADLIGEFAMLLPVRVLARLFGFSDEEGPALVTALNDMIDGRERALAGQSHLFHVDDGAGGRPQGRARRGRRVPDARRPLRLHRGGDLQDLMVMLAAGHQPTADWIGNSLHLMLTDARFAASLFGGRNSVAEAMNEVLWEDTPSQNVAARWASRDTQLGGRRIRAGDMVLLGLQGANADPQVRTDGSALTGGNGAHFSFGHGSTAARSRRRRSPR
ncbi:cytochrome P450 [Streptomyces heliomycini]